MRGKVIASGTQKNCKVFKYLKYAVFQNVAGMKN